MKRMKQILSFPFALLCGVGPLMVQQNYLDVSRPDDKGDVA